MVSRLIRCVRSGPKCPSATVPAMAWQFDAGVRFENLARPSSHASNPRRFLLLLFDPLLKVCRRLHVNPQQHLWRVACRNTARTARGRGPQSPGIESTSCSRDWRSGPSFPPDAAPRKLWSVSAERVSGKSAWDSIGLLTGTCNFVGGHNAVLWIAKFPPELVSDGDYVDAR